MDVRKKSAGLGLIGFGQVKVKNVYTWQRGHRVLESTISSLWGGSAKKTDGTSDIVGPKTEGPSLAVKSTPPTER